MMMYFKYNCIFILSCIALISSSQCSFQYISNDTTIQDYIELIYSRKNIDEIITIGSRINRGVINDSVYNAPVFQTFDYCGNVVNRIIYKYIGSYKLRHTGIPTHNAYREEPIGNTSIRTKNDEFLLVDKAIDTVTKELVLILYKISDEGMLKTYKTLRLSNHEANQTTIKNVIELQSGKILVILWDYLKEYVFYYFDNNSEFLLKKTVGASRGILSIKEVDSGEFICSSLAYDALSFQFYRLDTNSNIKWIVNPYNSYGSAREILVKNNKIYVTGSTNSFGVFLISDLNGNVLKEFRYDSFCCKQRFCRAFLNSDNSFIISGYIEYCDSSDQRSPDIAIINIDSSGSILWNVAYNFKSALGTTGSNGYFTDYGGFIVEIANDGGIITNGISKYNRLVPGGVLHEDALLVKSVPNIVANSSDNKINEQISEFNLMSNPVNHDLNIIGPLDQITKWTIYSLEGKKFLYGNKWPSNLNISNLRSGIYIINILDLKDNKLFLKFMKI